MGTPRRTNNAMHSPHCQHYEETENTTKLKLLENREICNKIRQSSHCGKKKKGKQYIGKIQTKITPQKRKSNTILLVQDARYPERT